MLGIDDAWTEHEPSGVALIVDLGSGWRLVVDGDKMTGTGTLLPSNAVVRRMELERKK